MPPGSPATVTERTTPRRTGRPMSLTEETERQILAAVRNHQRDDVAAELAHVGASTLRGWKHDGAKARVFLAEGGTLARLTAYDRRCLDFLAALDEARAQAEGIAVRGWLAAGLQPQTTTKRRQRFAGMDDQGQPIMVTETSEEIRPPDASLLVKWLERRVEAYRPTAALDVDLAVSLRAAGLAERVRAHQEAIAATSSEV